MHSSKFLLQSGKTVNVLCYWSIYSLHFAFDVTIFLIFIPDSVGPPTFMLWGGELCNSYHLFWHALHYGLLTCQSYIDMNLRLSTFHVAWMFASYARRRLSSSSSHLPACLLQYSYISTIRRTSTTVFSLIFFSTPYYSPYERSLSSLLGNRPCCIGLTTFFFNQRKWCIMRFFARCSGHSMVSSIWA